MSLFLQLTQLLEALLLLLALPRLQQPAPQLLLPVRP